ncbi:MAG: dinitrogenase iron-molybdenum cofactor biosynthesis protein [Massilibacillus sp.]|jgi:predicted Fe-Mo cluster-binding NifX family protein|nr:dinitrogenase iron-molybdenum cofactor biosynthesis protein [Massilibacillus sp.]
MKIAMPVNDKSMESCVGNTFGRTSYFLVYDTETKESIFVDNSAAASQGGAGIKAAQTVVDSQVEALITPQCGENAAKVIQASNIKIYKIINDSIQDNINAFKHGELSLLEKIHGGFHGHGGK